VAFSARPFFKAASAFDAFMSCQNSRPALNTSKPAMMKKSSQRPSRADTMAAASIM
jgi:hypothetical protein